MNMKPLETIDLGNLYALGNAFVQVTAKVYPDDSFALSDVELEEDRKRFESGDLQSFVVVVEATLPDTAINLIGTDVLGGVWASKLEDITNSITDNSMISGALEDLRQNHKALLKGLKTFKLDA